MPRCFASECSAAAAEQSEQEADAGRNRKGREGAMADFVLDFVPCGGADPRGFIANVAGIVVNDLAKVFAQVGQRVGNHARKGGAGVPGVGGRRRAELLQAPLELAQELLDFRNVARGRGPHIAGCSRHGALFVSRNSTTRPTWRRSKSSKKYNGFRRYWFLQTLWAWPAVRRPR